MPELQKNNKTKNKSRLFFGVPLVLFGVIAIFNGVTSMFEDSIRLLAPNGSVAVEVMNTSEQRAKGLSGRDSLKDSEGMLFVFDETSTENCFWMRDMKFSIDMVWLSEDKEVVTVKSDVSASTYPDTFCPDTPAKYGLEVRAGRAGQLGIATNTVLRF